MITSTSTKTKTATKRWAMYKLGYGPLSKSFHTRDEARMFKASRSNYKIFDTISGNFVR